MANMEKVTRLQKGLEKEMLGKWSQAGRKGAQALATAEAAQT